LKRNAFGVLVVDCTPDYGGAFEIAFNLVKHADRIEPASSCLVSTQPPEILNARVSGAFASSYLPLNRAHFARGNTLALALNAGRNMIGRELPAAYRLSRVIRAFGATVVHLNNGLAMQVHGALASRLSGCTCVVSYRAYEYPSRLTRPMRGLVERHIVSSRTVKDHLINVLGIPPEKIADIYDPVDTDVFNPQVPPADLEKLFGIPRGRKVFAIFGRVISWKGHPVFLRAARMVLEAVPDAHAMIVGNPTDDSPEYAEELRNLTQELGIADRTTFTGYRSDIAPLITACEVLVHASTIPEPFGLVVVEAMACGRPCVAMDEGGPVGMIDSGMHGLLVPPNQPEAMARAITTLLTQPETAAAFGAAARTRCVEKFSAPVIAKQHLELYHEVAERKWGAGARRPPAGRSNP
jgi:glycosyltransferase involved in cell wall biosynthesis